jgi:nitroimidazol reductase NimA-like FMN-containing flavoprotein (pyridoxamine 5'-phosphate oxidase superfamily)
MSYQRHMVELTRAECLQLLGTVPVGRIVFTHHALPAIRPVNHVVDFENQLVVVRATIGAAISAAASPSGIVVAYEADLLDPGRQLGWSVIVTGTARVIADKVVAERYRGRLDPWIGQTTNDVISISTDIVHGYRLEPAGLPGASPEAAAV